VCRSDRPISPGMKRKIAQTCDVDNEAVVSAADAPSIYDIPKVLHAEGLDAYVVRRLHLPFRDVDWQEWDELLRRVHRPAKHVTIALVGKYVDLPDAYLSVTEALRAGGVAHDAKVEIRWVTSDDCAEPEGASRALDGVDGVTHSRAASAFAASRASWERSSTRVSVRSHVGSLPGPAMHGDRRRAQPRRARGRQLRGVRCRYAAPGHRHHGRPARRRRRRTRHGRHDAAGSLSPRTCSTAPSSAEAYGAPTIDERHRHPLRSQTTPIVPRSRMPAWLFSGTSPEGRLVEFAELPRDMHPFFVGTQGAPGVPLATDPRTSVVRGVHRGRVAAGGRLRRRHRGSLARRGRP